VEHGARVFDAASCHHKPEVVGGVREGEAAGLLRGFFAGLRASQRDPLPLPHGEGE